MGRITHLNNETTATKILAQFMSWVVDVVFSTFEL